MKIKKTIYFKKLFFLTLAFFSLVFFAENVKAEILDLGIFEVEYIPTYESIGFALTGQDIIGYDCSIYYKKTGDSSWNQGLDLWFDDRSQEYKGSLVHLDSGRDYQIKFIFHDSENPSIEEEISVSTWSEYFPIGEVNFLSETLSETLVINESGTEEGYILYTSIDNLSNTIDLNNNPSFESCVEINGSYIIIRGLDIKNCYTHGIKLGENANNIIIEKNNISNWGHIDSEGEWGTNSNSAIYAGSTTNVSKITIQGNRIFDPNYGSNSWGEWNTEGQSYHPRGPNAIALFESQGNHVIRHNTIYSDNGNYYNDILGAGWNFGYKGFPNKDSDIYNNFLSDCWDDAIESEGANKNVRIWGNYINNSMVRIAIAATSIGPIYIWRNYGDTGRADGSIEDSDLDSTGSFLKLAANNDSGTLYGGGMKYVFHNTLLQNHPVGKTYSLGPSSAVSNVADLVIDNIISRNNIFYIRKSWWASVNTTKNLDGVTFGNNNDFNYDLYWGIYITDPSFSADNSINDVPIYDNNNEFGVFALAEDSPGFDDGVILYNFNDNYTGLAPDIGAFEAGSEKIFFGADASYYGCGDGVCDENEACSSCPQDCGEYDTIPPSAPSGLSVS